MAQNGSKINISMGSFEAVSEFSPNPGEEVRCLYEGELELPNPMCDATMWKRSEAGTSTGDGNSLTRSFELAPNPANSTVNVIYELTAWTEASTASLEVHDLRGARIAEFDIFGDQGIQKLNTTQWPSGMYMVILRVNGKLSDQQRLIIQR